MADLSRRILSLVRDDVAALSPYDPNFTPCKINLSANENTYGMPAKVRAAIDAAIAATPTNRYPDPMSNELRDQIATWHHVRRENVCVGNGGDELLFNFFLAFGGPGKRLVDCPPTFTVYDIYSKMLGTSVVRCWRDEDTFDIDVNALLLMAREADRVIVTSPTNPTDYGNLVILHTYSKAFCLAGVRVGYVLAAPDVIDVLGAVRQPYTADVFAQAAAQAVTSLRGVFTPTINRIRVERERLADALSGLEGMRVWPSQGNFLLVRMPEAAIVRARLRDERSILVRDFSATQGLENCLRITVGTPGENDELVDAIGSILKEVV